MASGHVAPAATFAALGLDARLTRALVRALVTRPTLVQATAIPIALEGKDVLCRAKTGSGKTAAYALPLLHKILVAKQAQPDLRGVLGLVLVPTRELCEQVGEQLKMMTFYCSRFVSHVCLTADTPMDAQKRALANLPDVVVATPGRIVAHLDAGNVALRDTLQTLVIDEADLVLSFGFQDDVRRIVTHLPKVVQTLLMSATLNADVEELKQLVLKKAAILRLEEGSDDQALTQYFVMATDTDKYLLLFFILRLKLVQGKAIIFVNSIERCYRLKLFLEQFAIKACVLNAELPQNSRYHIVQEFNRGVYDYIIATDEAQRLAEPKPDATATAEPAEGEGEGEALAKPKPAKKAKRGLQRDAEFGVARGVDFKDVAAVFNFDFPATVASYMHRVGRTARAGKDGTALSFVTEEDVVVLKQVQRHYSDADEDGADERAHGSALKPFKFKMDEVNAFRYRVDDALRAVTRTTIREARLKEIKSEILNSERLKAHFEDNPHDLAALRHDKTLLQHRVAAELRHVPKYLLPRDKTAAAAVAASTVTTGDDEPVDADAGAPGMLLVGKKRQWHGPQGQRGQTKRKKADPLRTFKRGSAAGGGSSSSARGRGGRGGRGGRRRV